MDPRREIDLTIEGMHCASCVARVEKALQRVEGVQDAAVNLAAERAQVSVLAGVDPHALVEAVQGAGFGAELIGASDDAGEDPLARQREQQDRAARAMARRAVAAGIAAVVVMILSMGPMIGLRLPLETELIDVITWLLASFVVFGAGRGFFAGAWQRLRHRDADMNTLVALGTGSAWTYSTAVVFFPSWFAHTGVEVKPYFDSAAMIVAFLLVGRWLEARARRRAGDALRGLLQLGVRRARVLRDGEERELDVREVVVGDRVVVRPGERIPLDGVVEAGRAAIDESAFTGESLPVERGEGDHVFGSTFDHDGRLVVRVTHVGEDTALARIVRMVEHAQSSKAPIQRTADRIASVFVPVVLVVAAVSLVAWWGSGAGIDRAMLHFVSVLIIACPCAMGLATPAAILVGTGRGAEQGILFKSGAVLEAMRGIDVVVFDKTGTLTHGRPRVTSVRVDDDGSDAVLAAVSAVEHGSEHPVARAVLDHARERDVEPGHAKDFVAKPGRGVRAEVDGTTWFVGSTRWLEEERVEVDEAWAQQARAREGEGNTILWAWTGKQARALFAVGDTVREGSAETIGALHALGLRTVLLTGDREGTARAVAGTLGIDEVIAEVLPEDKVDAVRRLQEEGRRVAMVGDGINDAAALATADVGIAIGAGTEVAVEASDVTLLRDDPRDIARALLLGRRTVRTIHQNLFWAFAYNTAGIPVAAGVLAPLGIVLHPALAAAAMALSSVSVLANSLRLRRAV